MDRLKLAFVELQASWRVFRDHGASVDGNVAWSADAVDADLQRLVLSFAAVGIVDSSGEGDGASDRTAGAFCALDVGCEIEHPDALPEKPWFLDRIGISSDSCSDAPPALFGSHGVPMAGAGGDAAAMDVVEEAITPPSVGSERDPPSLRGQS